MIDFAFFWFLMLNDSRPLFPSRAVCLDHHQKAETRLAQFKELRDAALKEAGGNALDRKVLGIELWMAQTEAEVSRWYWATFIATYQHRRGSRLFALVMWLRNAP